jgi:hypothetical protein
MNVELETRLSELYPRLFRGQDMPVTENLMSFGCECGDGWFTLINTACSLIATHEEAAEKSDFLFTQIKEKYGTLRIYYTGGNAYIDGVVNMAEAMSGETCELCGAPGKRGGISWITTRCDKCTPSDKEPEDKEPEAFRELKIKRLEAINETLRNELILQQQAMLVTRLDKATEAAWNKRSED